MARHFGQTLQWFTACLFGDDPVRLEPATTWTDDLWFLDQDDREVLGTDGWWPLQPGHAAGRLVGGNLSTLSLLQGTPYMPSLADAVLIVEDDEESHPANFARNLTSLLQLPDAAAIRGLVVGQFQRATNMTRQLLEEIIDRQPPLADCRSWPTSTLVTPHRWPPSPSAARSPCPQNPVISTSS